MQAWSYDLYPRGYAGDGVLLVPLMIVATVAAAVLSAQAFPHQGIVAAGVAASGTALFAWGEVRVDAALENLIAGSLPWWSEKVIVETIGFGVPAVLISAFLAYLLSRRFQPPGG